MLDLASKPRCVTLPPMRPTPPDQQLNQDPQPLLQKALLLFLGFLAVLPIWLSDPLPMLDAGQHQRIATILHDWKHLPLYAQHFEKVALITPTSSYYALVDRIARLHDVPWAFRVVLSLSLLVILLSSWLLARALGKSAWLVVAVVPLLHNAEFFLGNGPYLLALAAFLSLLVAHIHLLRKPTWYGLVAVASLFILLATTHYLLWLAALVILPLLSARRQRNLISPLRDMALAMPSLLLLLPWLRQEFFQRNLAINLRQPLQFEPRLPLDNLRAVPDELFGSFVWHPAAIESAADLLSRRTDVVGTLWLVGILLWLFASIRQQRKMLDQMLPQKPYLSTALGVLLVAYFFLPLHLISPIWLYLLNVRLLPLMAILLVLSLPFQPLLPNRDMRLRVWLGNAAIGISAVSMPLWTGEAMLVGAREFGDVRAAMSSMPSGARVLTLNARSGSQLLRGRPSEHVGELYDVLIGGYTPDSWGEAALKPVRAKPAAQMPTPNDASGFDWSRHGQYYHYIAVLEDPIAPNQRYSDYLRNLPRVFQRGGWQVYLNPKPQPWPVPPPSREGVHLAECLTQWAGFSLQATTPTLSHQEILVHSQLSLPLDCRPPRPRQLIQGRRPVDLPRQISDTLLHWLTLPD